MVYLLLATYGTVLFAELLGDKSFYTISSLTTRFRAAHVLGGISVAFAGKMLVAVLVGQAIAGLPPALVAGISAATFFATALAIWFKNARPESAGRARPLFPSPPFSSQNGAMSGRLLPPRWLPVITRRSLSGWEQLQR
jgi:putative Ca2+/H+ antiporter (TMEM165/GDT1 family)